MQTMNVKKVPYIDEKIINNQEAKEIKCCQQSKNSKRKLNFEIEYATINAIQLLQMNYVVKVTGDLRKQQPNVSFYAHSNQMSSAQGLRPKRRIQLSNWEKEQFIALLKESKDESSSPKVRSQSNSSKKIQSAKLSISLNK